MTRVAGWFGVALAWVLLAAGLQVSMETGVLLQGARGAVGAGATGLAAWQALRGRGRFQLLLAGIGLLVIVLELPGYFREPRFWPTLALVVLGTSVAGLNVLAFVLGRYEPPPHRGREGL